jgi:hypothetical protein
MALSQVLLHFQNDVNRRRDGEAVADHAHRLVNGGHGRFHELHVHRRTGDLDYVSDILCHKSVLGS